MRAWQQTQFGLDHLSLRDLPDPQPPPGHLVIKTNALSLNYRDLLVIKGTADVYGRLEGNLVSWDGDIVLHSGAVVAGDVLAFAPKKK